MLGLKPFYVWIRDVEGDDSVVNFVSKRIIRIIIADNFRTSMRSSIDSSLLRKMQKAFKALSARHLKH